MSTRVRKVLGYGTNEFPKEKHAELNKKIAEDPTVEDFFQWSREHFLEIMDLASSRVNVGIAGTMLEWELGARKKETKLPMPFLLSDCIGWGNPLRGKSDPVWSKLVLVPPVYHCKWYRRDDDIDYIEELDSKKDGPKDRFKLLRLSLYPYNKGEPPAAIAAMCLFLGIPELWDQLTEVLYVYWC